MAREGVINVLGPAIVQTVSIENTLGLNNLCDYLYHHHSPDIIGIQNLFIKPHYITNILSN